MEEDDGVINVFTIYNITNTIFKDICIKICDLFT